MAAAGAVRPRVFRRGTEQAAGRRLAVRSVYGALGDGALTSGSVHRSGVLAAADVSCQAPVLGYAADRVGDVRGVSGSPLVRRRDRGEPALSILVAPVYGDDLHDVLLRHAGGAADVRGLAERALADDLRRRLRVLQPLQAVGRALRSGRADRVAAIPVRGRTCLWHHRRPGFRTDIPGGWKENLFRLSGFPHGGAVQPGHVSCDCAADRRAAGRCFGLPPYRGGGAAGVPATSIRANRGVGIQAVCAESLPAVFQLLLRRRFSPAMLQALLIIDALLN